MSRKRRTPSTPAIIDACCLIDLLASGRAEEILRATRFAWHLPAAVQGEVQYVRQHDPAQPGHFIAVPADLTPLLSSGVLTLCQPDDLQEQARFVDYAARFRSDGEAMCLAIAEARGWPVATDDRKAIRVACQAGLTALSCPELIKAWAVTIRPDRTTLIRVLTDIQTFAHFRPTPTMPEADLWIRQIPGP